MNAIDELLQGIPVPKMMRVTQSFDQTRLEDVGGALTDRIESNIGYQSVKKGMKVAVAVGSRGITNLPLCVKIIVAKLKQKGAEPFIVPAMGSHGGASADGQRNMLIGMGITEEYVGAPIHSSMETVRLSVTQNGLPVVIDKNAHEADGIVIINRIKPHTSFRGTYESGLMKMCAIGLGKQHGADLCHELGFGKMAVNIPEIAKVMIEKENILFAVGLIENAYHQTHTLVVLNKDEIEHEEIGLQLLSRKLCSRLQFDQIDVLIIDEIGKDISGTGFDTGIVGRYHTPFISGGPSVSKLGILDLTERSHGNVNGVGIADYTTKRVFDKFDREQSYPNALTSTVPLTVKIPMFFKNDLQVFQACIKTCNILDKANVRLVRIKNTLKLDTIEVSESLRQDVIASEYLELNSDPYDLNFDESGNLL